MIPPPDPGPDGALVAEPGDWVDGSRWSSMYQRLGPLEYSDLGRRHLSPLSDPAPVARWLAAAADRWWVAGGRPDPFTLVVVSGDDGRLAAALLDADPGCAAALRYVLVHPDHADPGRPPAALATALPLENPAFLYPAAPAPPEGTDVDEDAERRPAQGIGPLITFLAGLPGLGDSGPASAVVAVGYLSRLPYDAFVVASDGNWSEVRLVHGGGTLAEIQVPLESVPAGVDASKGAGRHLRWTGALHWLRQVLATGDTSTLAVLDAELPDALLAAVGRPPEPAEDVEGTPLRAVQWRLG